MWTCSKCGEHVEDSFDTCWSCGASAAGDRDPGFAPEVEPSGAGLEAASIADSSMKLSTTHLVPGFRVTATLGIVGREAILGANIVADVIAGVSDVVGGRTGIYESRIKRARSLAIADMVQAAKNGGAGAVVGVRLDHETIRGGMLMVCAYGTAVTLLEDAKQGQG